VTTSSISVLGAIGAMKVISPLGEQALIDLEEERYIKMQNYVTPEFELVIIETNDIIANSELAVKPGDNDTSVPKEWWD
jgi:hypothetical protein